MSFKSKSDDNIQKIILINGIRTDHLRFFFQGWSGNIELERSSAVLDQYFAMLEQNYFQGKAEATASITETIQEPVNGSISQYRCKGVILSYSDAGEYTGDKSVKQVTRVRVQKAALADRMNTQPKLTLHDAQSPTAQVIAKAAAEHTVQDASGRKIHYTEKAWRVGPIPPD